MMYDRKTKKHYDSEPEDKSVKFLYNTIIGRVFLKIFILKFVTSILGWYNSTKFSKSKIPKFAKQYNLKYDNLDNYNNFNDFFTREEQFDLTFDAKDMISVAQSKLSIYNINDQARFNIKNQSYDVSSLLNDPQLAKQFEGGTCLVFRLCVDNYHRYCYFDGGSVAKTQYIKGFLHTVRPIAYERYQPLIQNTRNYSVLSTENFGTCVFMEVGAIMVGKFTNNTDREFTKGQERGYFELGGSTVVVLVEKDKLVLDEDLASLIDTETEVAVQYGEKIGRSI